MCTVGFAALAFAGPAVSLTEGDPCARAFSARCSGAVNLPTDVGSAK
jgi:hypothetical protein